MLCWVSHSIKNWGEWAWARLNAINKPSVLPKSFGLWPPFILTQCISCICGILPLYHLGKMRTHKTNLYEGQQQKCSWECDFYMNHFKCLREEGMILLFLLCFVWAVFDFVLFFKWVTNWTHASSQFFNRAAYQPTTALLANLREPKHYPGLVEATLWKMAGGLALPFLFYSLPCRNRAIKSCPLSDPVSVTDVISLHKLQPVYRPSGE